MKIEVATCEKFYKNGDSAKMVVLKSGIKQIHVLEAAEINKILEHCPS